MRKQSVATVDLQATVDELRELGQRQEDLKRAIADCNRREPELKAHLDKAKRLAEREAVHGLRPVPEAISNELDAAQATLEDLDAQRSEAQEELESLKERRFALIGDSMREAWRAHIEAVERRIEEAIKLSDAVEPLVAPYARACEQEAKTKALLDSILGPLGGDRLKIETDLQAETPRPRVPDEPNERQALRRAGSLKALYSRDLRYR